MSSHVRKNIQPIDKQTWHLKKKNFIGKEDGIKENFKILFWKTFHVLLLNSGKWQWFQRWTNLIFLMKLSWTPRWALSGCDVQLHQLSVLSLANESHVLI
jgi:hypothetical protein